MTTTPTTTTVLSYIRRWINRARVETSTDAALLRRFTQEGDEDAFALLMDRHGAMVLGTARRVVGDEHLAEDVFQAVFLTFARKARRLRRAAALPAWLHAVACRLALTAVRQRKRRHRAESKATPCPTVCPTDSVVSREQLDILDDELRRLPERFRLPLVLCCLEGRSQAEAAAFSAGHRDPSRADSNAPGSACASGCVAAECRSPSPPPYRHWPGQALPHHSAMPSFGLRGAERACLRWCRR